MQVRLLGWGRPFAPAVQWRVGQFAADPGWLVQPCIHVLSSTARLSPHAAAVSRGKQLGLTAHYLPAGTVVTVFRCAGAWGQGLGWLLLRWLAPCPLCGHLIAVCIPKILEFTAAHASRSDADLLRCCSSPALSCCSKPQLLQTVAPQVEAACDRLRQG